MITSRQFLLDTHTVLWMLTSPERLTEQVRALIVDERVRKYVSMVSFWEAAIKVSLGKLRLVEHLDVVVTRLGQAGVATLGLEYRHVREISQLAWHHRDPFDRMLVAQCLAEGLSLLSRDEALDPYGVDRVW